MFSQYQNFAPHAATLAVRVFAVTRQEQEATTLGCLCVLSEKRGTAVPDADRFEGPVCSPFRGWFANVGLDSTSVFDVTAESCIERACQL